MIRSPITTPGPLNVSATITAGDTYPAVTIQAPLGPEFQAITELADPISPATFTNTNNVIWGASGGFIYKDAVTAEKKAVAERYLGAF